MSFPELNGQRVTLMGLGRFGGGVAAAEFLFEHGARLTITDLQTEAELSESRELLQQHGVTATWLLGGHPEAAFSNCDLLVVSPAVKPNNPWVQKCRDRGITITSEIQLFVDRCPAQTIAVTGSNGKSTTTRLIAHLLRPHLPAHQKILVGGNIGHSLLPELKNLTDQDVVILELSSFQLQQLSASQFSPQVAVVTNFTPNHLNWHPDLEHYRTSKQRIGARQGMHDTLVLPDELDDWPVRGRCLRFGLSDQGEDGAFCEDGLLITRLRQQEEAEAVTLSPALRGQHGCRNAAAAAAAVSGFLGGPVSLSAELRTFAGLPHRLQIVAHAAGRVFCDDSSATTPESTMAALQAVSQRVVLLTGGADKQVDLQPLAATIAAQVAACVTMGQTGGRLAQLIQDNSADAPIVRQSTGFADAFARAVALSRPGDMVLLSPGCSSQDWFTDFRQRGRQFSELARNWCESEDEIRAVSGPKGTLG